jgi:hypothetical protein
VSLRRFLFDGGHVLTFSLVQIIKYGMIFLTSISIFVALIVIRKFTPLLFILVNNILRSSGRLSNYFAFELFHLYTVVMVTRASGDGTCTFLVSPGT